MQVSILSLLAQFTSTVLDILRKVVHIWLLRLWMSKLSRQVSSAYSLSTCGFRLFDPHKELERSKNLGQPT